MTSACTPGPPEPLATEAPTAKIKPSLYGISSTTLVTLAARAAEYDRPTPILQDPWAARTLAQLDYAPPSTFLTTQLPALVSPLFYPNSTQPTSNEATGYNPRTIISQPPGFNQGIAIRARCLDAWTLAYLADPHPEGVTVLHLACGLDSRSLRLQTQWRRAAGGKTRWIDVDMPEVVELRRRVLPDPDHDKPWDKGSEGQYRLLGLDLREADAWESLSVAAKEGLSTDDAAHRPVLVIMEGLLMYLHPPDVAALFTRITEHFPAGGRMIFDVLGTFAMRSQIMIRPIASTGAVMSYGADREADIEGLVEGSKVRVREWLRAWDVMEWQGQPLWWRLGRWACGWVPVINNALAFVQADFGTKEDGSRLG